MFKVLKVTNDWNETIKEVEKIKWSEFDCKIHRHLSWRKFTDEEIKNLFWGRSEEKEVKSIEAKDVDRDELNRLYEEKFWKKASHLMKNETIINKLSS